MHEIFKHPIIQHQLRNHYRLAGVTHFLALGGDEAERHLETIGQTRQHDGEDDVDSKVWLSLKRRAKPIMPLTISPTRSQSFSRERPFNSASALSISASVRRLSGLSEWSPALAAWLGFAVTAGSELPSTAELCWAAGAFGE